MWALCLVSLSPKHCFEGFPPQLCIELEFFKEEMDNNNPFGGNI